MNGQHKLALWVISIFLLTLFPMSARSAPLNRVALVVRFSDGSVRTQCVEFSESQITGLDVLARSGLSVIYEVNGSMGAAICKIQNDGCNFPSQPCFCQCSGGSSCVYWSYWHLKNGAWQYSQSGASNYMVHNGDMEGWVWGAGSPNNAPQPPMIDFNSVCAPPPTSTPSPTPAPTATHTPRPTATSVPAATVSFTAQPDQITAGECSTLRWDVDYAQAVFLDGAGVSGHDSRQVCPRQTQTFELRVVSASGETQRRVTVKVIQPPATVTPSTPIATPITQLTLPRPTQTPAQGAPPQATTRPAPTPSVVTATLVASPSPPTVTSVSTVAASPTPQKVAAARSERTSAQPTEPEMNEASKGFPLELLGWAAIVGALLAALALVQVLRRQGRAP